MSETNYKRLGDYIREVENKNNTHFLRIDRVKHLVFFCSLDVIISIDYCMKSQCVTQFHIYKIMFEMQLFTCKFLQL